MEIVCERAPVQNRPTRDELEIVLIDGMAEGIVQEFDKLGLSRGQLRRVVEKVVELSFDAPKAPTK